MAATPRPRSIWATHRGRQIRGLIILAFVASVITLFLPGLVGAKPASSAAATAAPSVPGAPPSKPPKVAAAPANPFQPYVGVNDEAGPDADSPTAAATPTAAPLNSGAYQQMILLATQVTPPFATFTYQQTPEQYVNTVPGLSKAAKKALTASATAAWPQIQAGQVVASASPVQSTPRIIDYDETGGTARVAVSVVQTLTGTGGQSTSTRSYPVDLRLVDGIWSVTSISAS